MTDFTQKRELLLAAITAGKYPRHLYKYRNDSIYTDSIFKDLTMWFSAPQSFNDPFDCNLSEISYHTQDEANQFLKHILEGQTDREILLLIGTTIAEAERSLASSKEAILSKTGILCLSKKFENVLMWSHYTNSHKGLVIELDLVHDLDFFLSPIQVRYTDAYEPTNYFKDQHSAISQIISTKSSCWSYEEEVRIVKNNVTGSVFLNPKAIRRVIFGCRSDADFISRIRGLCSVPELEHVLFSQLKSSYGKFALEISDLAT
ncbi:DUF2971 domain-containing protein [Xanthomonas campestris pv. phormiicola]|nr:DUF2971 domain-containing protein [Xanthomonas campestris pv. phormiicola]UYC15134.1 DUF2971 domain-containing protein [Xanthomonas campestris pv. phormiicola]